MRTSHIVSVVLLAACPALPAESLSLVERSPFIDDPKQIKQALPKNQPKPKNKINHFELRGVVSLGNRFMFSVLDKRTGLSIWVDPKKNVNGFKIESYDPNSQEVTFRWNEQQGTLKMALPDGISVPVVVGSNDGVTERQQNGDSTRKNRVAARGRSTIPNSNQIKTKPLKNKTLIKFGAVGQAFNSLRQSESIYESENLFASSGTQNRSIVPEAVAGNQSGRAPKESLSIFSRNRVHNPSGKLPK